jgi:transcriptional regulator with XRE-family HTH domain
VSAEADELRRRFGANVRTLRLERGLTQQGLADLAGLSTTYIGKIEGGLGNPRATTLAVLATALSVAPKVLLSWAD